MYKSHFEKITFRTYELKESLLGGWDKKVVLETWLNCSDLRFPWDQVRSPGEFAFCRTLTEKCKWNVGREEERPNMYWIICYALGTWHWSCHVIPHQPGEMATISRLYNRGSEEWRNLFRFTQLVWAWGKTWTSVYVALHSGFPRPPEHLQCHERGKGKPEGFSTCNLKKPTTSPKCHEVLCLSF